MVNAASKLLQIIKAFLVTIFRARSFIL